MPDVNTVDEKAIVAIRPKPAFRPLFEIATTRAGKYGPRVPPIRALLSSSRCIKEAGNMADGVIFLVEDNEVDEELTLPQTI